MFVKFLNPKIYQADIFSGKLVNSRKALKPLLAAREDLGRLELWHDTEVEDTIRISSVEYGSSCSWNSFRESVFHSVMLSYGSWTFEGETSFLTTSHLVSAYFSPTI